MSVNVGGEISSSAEMREGGGGAQYSQDIQERKIPTEQLETSISPNKEIGVFKQVVQESVTSNTISGEVVVEKKVIQKEARNVSVIATSSTDSSESAIHNLESNSIHENDLNNIFSYMRKTATVRFSPVIAEPMDMRTSKSSSTSTTTRPLLILATTVLDSTVWNSFVDGMMHRIWLKWNCSEIPWFCWPLSHRK